MDSHNMIISYVIHVLCNGFQKLYVEYIRPVFGDLSALQSPNRISLDIHIYQRITPPNSQSIVHSESDWGWVKIIINTYYDIQFIVNYAMQEFRTLYL